MELPERIWAETEPYDFPGYSPCWVWHSEAFADEDGIIAEYVRADALTAAEARADALEKRLEAVRAAWLAFEGATVSADHYGAVDRIRALLDEAGE